MSGTYRNKLNAKAISQGMSHEYFTLSILLSEQNHAFVNIIVEIIWKPENFPTEYFTMAIVIFASLSNMLK